MSSKIYIVGMGPGTGEMMTPQADHALCGSDVIVGYPVYLKLLGGKYRKKEFLSTPMKQEVRRCEMCFEEAEKGKTVAMVCSGDAGVYGMASLLYASCLYPHDYQAGRDMDKSPCPSRCSFHLD